LTSGKSLFMKSTDSSMVLYIFQLPMIITAFFDSVIVAPFSLELRLNSYGTWNLSGIQDFFKLFFTKILKKKKIE